MFSTVLMIMMVQCKRKTPYPSIQLHVQGKPSRNLDTTAPVTISTRQGVNANRSTAHDSFFSFTTSRPSPALVRITVRATFLQYRRRNIKARTICEVLPMVATASNTSPTNVRIHCMGTCTCSTPSAIHKSKATCKGVQCNAKHR